VTSTGAGAPAYPVKVGPTGRYLVDRRGEPVLVHGDAAWSLLASTTPEGAERYLSDRHQRGVNSVIVNLLEHLFAPDPPRNLAGDEPFAMPGDFSTPNEAYFAHADRVIRMAGEKGIQVILAPCYLGYRDPHSPGFGGQPEGWFAEVLANGVDRCRDYGRYVGRRYRQFDNLVWMMACDRNPGDALEHVRAMSNGIVEGDGRHLMLAGVHPECKSVEEFPEDPWLTLNNTYTYAIVHQRLLEDYNHRPLLPNILVESTYEGEHNASDVQIRRQAYWALLCGACGQVMGNNPMWLFGKGWEEKLDSLGARAMTHLLELFAPRRWWELVPDQAHEIVIDGLGEFRGLDYCSAARTADGTLVIAYMPTPRTISVDMGRLAGGRAAASWYDPITGRADPAGDHPTRGPRDFTPPGAQDWVLVLEAKP